MNESKEKVLQGIGVSPGIAVGPAFLLPAPEEHRPSERRIADEEVERELARFFAAVEETKKQINALREKTSSQLGMDHAGIFDAQLMILDDEQVTEDVRRAMTKGKKNAEAAFYRTVSRYLHVLYGSRDAYLAERHADIRDVMNRVLDNLEGVDRSDVCTVPSPSVIIARDISPSDTARMERSEVLGFATDAGSQTSHTAIMAKALGIPAVVGLHMVTKAVREGDTILIDGHQGAVTVNPTQETLERGKAQFLKIEAYRDKLTELRDLPAETRDGRRITLSANIELPAEVPSVIESGAEGVGLYRTEFVYMNRSDLPSEEEQLEAYKKVLEGVKPNPVIIRTMDLGGDKFITHLNIPFEFNPFLGWRAIRFCLERRDIFEVQLRAILRAGFFGNLKLMYPMISSVEEVVKANAILAEVKEELSREGVPHAEDFEVGAMIEIPSAALTADILAKEVDFFSIGTNDLIQYTLAVERVNDKIAHLYQPFHPAVLRLMKNVVEQGRRNHIWVGICGEVATDPAMCLILVGMGLDEISASPAVVPRVKSVIRGISESDAKEFVKDVIGYTSPSKIESRAREMVGAAVPELDMG
jgi:phosphotransferase system enzyme I (PtsI)